METIEEVKTDKIIINFQPEFVENETEKISAQYFVLCENSEEINDEIYAHKILGVSILDWVQRACENRPLVLNLNEEQSIIEQIRPYLNGSKYSVVLYGNTPLVTKQHLNDLLGFVERKHLSVCKLEKGYVFKNEFISRMDEFFSTDTYDFSADDFFEVKNMLDAKAAADILKTRLLEFYMKNGVNFENSETIFVDALSEIAYMANISSGANISGSSKIGTNAKIGANAVITNSKIGDDVIIGANAVVEGSIIKSGAKIASGTTIKGSVVGENVTIDVGSKIVASAIQGDSSVGACSSVLNSKVEESVSIGSGVVVLKSKLETETKIDDGAKIVCNQSKN